MSEAPITDLILEIFRANGRLLAAGDRLVADLGLTSARWQVLGAVAMSPAPLPVAHVARNMGLSRQGVQRIANELAADGLARFEDNPHHARAKLVLLTGAGTSAYEKARARQAPWARSLAEGLAESDIASAAATLKCINDRLEEDRR